MLLTGIEDKAEQDSDDERQGFPNHDLNFELFHNVKGDFLTVFLRRGVKQVTDRMDGMASLADDLTEIAFTHFNAKSDAVIRIGSRNDHFAGVFDEMPDHKPQEFFHTAQRQAAVAPSAFLAILRAFLMMLLTVSDGRAPLLIQ